MKHIIKADYNDPEAAKIIVNLKEVRTNGIWWQNGKSNGKNAQKFLEDEEVYIYFLNLPDGTNRFLAKAKVKESDYGKEDKFYYSENVLECSNDNIKGFSLFDFNLLDIKYYDKIKLDLDKSEFSFLKGQQPKIYINEDKNSEIYYFLEKREKWFNKTKNTELKERLNVSCTYCQKYNNSFIKENGFYYYETHHIIEQNLSRKENKPKWYTKSLIDEDFNKIILCPKHHREIHYGKLEKREEILNKILEISNFKKNLLSFIKDKYSVQEIMIYIYNQYGLNYMNEYWELFNKYINQNTKYNLLKSSCRSEDSIYTISINKKNYYINLIKRKSTIALQIHFRDVERKDFDYFYEHKSLFDKTFKYKCNWLRMNKSKETSNIEVETNCDKSNVNNDFEWFCENYLKAIEIINKITNN